VPDEAFLAIGMRNYWDGYFAGKLGRPRRDRPARLRHGPGEQLTGAGRDSSGYHRDRDAGRHHDAAGLSIGP
jgi:hypothetical protein